MPESIEPTSAVLEDLERGDRVEIPDLDVDGSVIDKLGQIFGGSGVVITDRGQRYLVSQHDGELVVEHWTGLTYRDALVDGRFDPGSDHAVLEGTEPAFLS